MLKEIRRKIAITYGLMDIVSFEECDFQGECPGFCPACDEELARLTICLYEKGIVPETKIGKEIFEKYLGTEPEMTAGREEDQNGNC